MVERRRRGRPPVIPSEKWDLAVADVAAGAGTIRQVAERHGLDYSRLAKECKRRGVESPLVPPREPEPESGPAAPGEPGAGAAAIEAAGMNAEEKPSKIETVKPEVIGNVETPPIGDWELVESTLRAFYSLYGCALSIIVNLPIDHPAVAIRPSTAVLAAARRSQAILASYIRRYVGVIGVGMEFFITLTADLYAKSNTAIRFRNEALAEKDAEEDAESSYSSPMKTPWKVPRQE